MVHIFTGSQPLSVDRIDDQSNDQLPEFNLNDFQPMLRNLVVKGVDEEQLSSSDDEQTPTRPLESTWTSELEERTMVLEMAVGRILSCLIPDDPLTPLLNKVDHPAEVATCISPALSNMVVPTKLRGSGKLNLEPNLSKLNEELLNKNNELEKQLKGIRKSIDELRSSKSCQQAPDLDSAPLSMSIMAEPYQEGFRIPHLETYDGSSDPNEHLHTYQAIIKTQNATDAMMCKLNPTSLKKYEGPICGFDKQPAPVEGLVNLPIYVRNEPHYRMASMNFLVVKMESTFNAIIKKATLCELKAVISQPHLCMKFQHPTE
ncbi:hypothetical protein SLEP1_g36919 [Rubroshorea leprosula]|uniref:Uncharacterized protein n=1 Tax=Rubroshorea leprosula TaxID=152421 RepID=A0AAV5KTC5_9ROSI|nr:hypothetical protein SLEP1_g36919 [Rubroshorea leprosula]